MIKQEIQSCLGVLNFTEEGRLSAEYTFPESFSGFQGHFPGNPVLPGVCQILAALVMLEKHTGKALHLTSVARARFLNTLGPDETLYIQGTYSANDPELSGKFQLVKRTDSGSVKVSNFSINAEFYIPLN